MEVYVNSELSLETENDINKKIRASGVMAVLIMNQTENRAYYSGSVSTSGKFDLKLFYGGSDNLVWRAVMDVDGGDDIALAVDDATKKFIMKLEADKSIPIKSK